MILQDFLMRRPVLTLALLSLVLTAFLVLPSLSIPLVSDDYSLMIESQTQPLLENFDHLYRPLRNLLLKALPQIWPMSHPEPYRLLVGALFASTLWLYAILLWRVRSSWLTAVFALLLASFYPRQQELLFWFAACQDLIMSIFGLLSIHYFINYRKSGNVYSILLSSILLAIAFGFKETAIVFLPLLFIVDLEFAARRGEDLWRWKAYLPLVAVFVIYAGLLLMDLRKDVGVGTMHRGNHGTRGLNGLASNLTRSLVAMVWPWVQIQPIRQMLKPTILVSALASSVVLAYSLGRFRWMQKACLLLIGMLAAIAPTVVFAPFPADRYIFVGSLVVIWPLAGALAKLWQAGPVVSRIGAGIFLAIYCFFGAQSLLIHRHKWAMAGIKVEEVRNNIKPLLQKHPEPSVVYGIGLPMRVNDGEYYVLPNGFRGLMITEGLPSNAKVVEHFARAPQSEDMEFRSRLESCPLFNGLSSRKEPLVLDLDVSSIRDRDPGCAVPLIEAYEHSHPEAFLRRN